MRGENSNGITRLKVWRRVNGRRDNCTLTLNTATGELLALECAAETSNNWVEDTLLGVRHRLEVRGGRAVRVVEPLSLPAAAFRHTVLDLAVPCPAGYEDIRAAYAKDLEDAGGANCSDCAEGQLRRTYMQQIKERQDSHAAAA